MRPRGLEPPRPKTGTRSLVWRVCQFRHGRVWLAIRLIGQQSDKSDDRVNALSADYQRLPSIDLVTKIHPLSSRAVTDFGKSPADMQTFVARGKFADRPSS